MTSGSDAQRWRMVSPNSVVTPPTADRTDAEVPRDRGRRRGLAWNALTAGLALLAGATLNQSLVLCSVIIVSVIALAAARIEPAGWIGFALALVWFARIATETGLAPRFLAFADFFIVPAAFLSAALIARRASPSDSSFKAPLLRAIAFIAAAVTASWIANISEPQRLIAGLALVLEPFLAIATLALAPPSYRMRRVLTTMIFATAAIQLPFVAAQAGATNHDDIRGTLTGAGAGAHVMAGGVFLASMFAASRVRSRIAGGLLVVGALAVCVISDAKQVLFVAPLGLVAISVLTPRTKDSPQSRRRATALALAVASIIVIASYGGSTVATGLVERSATTRGGKLAVVSHVARSLARSPFAVIFGLGPGESVSRFAFLTTPDQLKSGSPADALGLHEARHAATFAADADKVNRQHVGVSSATGAESSLLGVVGDYGLLGIASVTAALLVVGRHLRRRKTATAALALTGWILMLPLATISDWLEQPPFVLMLALMTGLALTGDAGDEAPQRRQALVRLPLVNAPPP